MFITTIQLIGVYVMQLWSYFCHQDYYHELVCTTERERFIVPVRAIGARGILDFPDDVHFPPAPVKYLSSKTLLVRNIGDRDCKFALYTEK